jgi:hypothetical protein
VNRLKIFSQQRAVLFRHFQRRMPQHLLQVERAPALPQIVNSEAVAEAVKRSLWDFDAKIPTEPLCITKHITTAQRSAMPRAENNLMLVTESPQEPSQFLAEWHAPVLGTLAMEG